MSQELMDALKKIGLLLTKQTTAIELLTLTLKENKKAFDCGFGSKPLEVKVEAVDLPRKPDKYDIANAEFEGRMRDAVNPERKPFADRLKDVT